ncbi:MAG: hypothetical protein QNK82_11465 [Akkermansiaceae bacterium]|jgi:hypothetical protein
MDTKKKPTLEHGIPDPETYLPGTPEWIWWAIGGGLLLLLLAIWGLFKLLHRPSVSPPEKPTQDFFGSALKRLKSLEPECPSRPLAEIAAHASLAIRAYLANSMSEPALYETVEEFKARQSNLPREAETLLTDLNNAKYARSSIDAERAHEFVARSRQCLETIHSARTVTT